MDMKRILQALDNASTKPVEGANDIKKALSIVTEGANPHKVALPVQMAMQHYQSPVIKLGRLGALLTIMQARETSRIKIEIRKKQLVKRLRT